MQPVAAELRRRSCRPLHLTMRSSPGSSPRGSALQKRPYRARPPVRDFPVHPIRLRVSTALDARVQRRVAYREKTKQVGHPETAWLI